MLLTSPAWQPADLGRPLPDSPYAVSVCMPRWRDVVGYEEKDPNIMEALSLGYPRFLLHPSVHALRDFYNKELGRRDIFVLPSKRVAKRALDYLKRRGGEGQLLPQGGEFGLVVSDREELLLEFWQHGGEIVSARRAEAYLQARVGSSSSSKETLRKRIAALSGAGAKDVYLFPSGMAAMFAALRVLPSGPTLQVGFPYVDALKLQQRWGREWALELEIPQKTDHAAIFCEVPSNPLIQTPDLEKLNSMRGDTPLIVDDTLATSLNLDLLPHCDIVWTSLTKFFSGVGDVMAGALILNASSPHYEDFSQLLKEDFEDLLYEEDAVCLESNSRDFEKRMRRVNQTTPELCRFLRQHPKVKRVHYTDDSAAYAALMKSDGGYGGVFSLEVEDPEAFYDRLRISKGPSLGTNFSLACPFTLLAHYHELDWAESCGVSRSLIRVSVGQESAQDLIERFEEAL